MVGLRRRGPAHGPGPIGDDRPVTDGEYDYAVQQKTISGGLSSVSSILAGRIGPKWDALVPYQSILSKPDMEWIATTLRGALGVPASDGPTTEANDAGPDDPLSSD